MKANSLILGTKKTRPTGKLLAKVLEGRYEEHFMPYDEEYNLIWRWGNSSIETNRDSQSERCVYINRKSAVSLNKAQMRIKLLSAHLPCPKLFDSDSIMEASYPLIARPVYHFRGKDFNIVKNEQQARYFLGKGYYLQEIVKSTEEFRIFVYDTKILECNIKVKVAESRTPLNKLIKNFRNGYIFKIIKKDTLPHELLDICRVANIAAGLSFSAIDCCIDSTNHAYIFELNSAPALIERKAIKFCNKILQFNGFDKTNKIVGFMESEDVPIEFRANRSQVNPQPPRNNNEGEINRENIGRTVWRFIEPMPTIDSANTTNTSDRAYTDFFRFYRRSD